MSYRPVCLGTKSLSMLLVLELASEKIELGDLGGKSVANQLLQDDNSCSQLLGLPSTSDAEIFALLTLTLNVTIALCGNDSKSCSIALIW